MRRNTREREKLEEIKHDNIRQRNRRAIANKSYNQAERSKCRNANVYGTNMNNGQQNSLRYYKHSRKANERFEGITIAIPTQLKRHHNSLVNSQMQLKRNIYRTVKFQHLRERYYLYCYQQSTKVYIYYDSQKFINIKRTCKMRRHHQRRFKRKIMADDKIIRRGDSLERKHGKRTTILPKISDFIFMNELQPFKLIKRQKPQQTGKKTKRLGYFKRTNRNQNASKLSDKRWSLTELNSMKSPEGYYKVDKNQCSYVRMQEMGVI